MLQVLSRNKGPETSRRKCSQYGGRCFNMGVIIKLYPIVNVPTMAHRFNDDTHYLHRKNLNSGACESRCGCQKSSHDVLSKTFQRFTANVVGISHLLQRKRGRINEMEQRPQSLKPSANDPGASREELRPPIPNGIYNEEQKYPGHRSLLHRFENVNLDENF
jgi:hypothetical protein